MKLDLKKGSTSQRAFIFVQDSSKTDGSGLAGLAFNTASLKWYFARDDDGNAAGTAVTLATATLGTWATGGFKEKDATNMPGVYEIGIPNAALATGSKSVVMMLSGAANMAPVLLEIQLVSYDPYDAVRLGLTALPNAAANAAGGLPISIAGALDMDDIGADVDAIETLAGTINTNVSAISTTIGVAGANLTNITLNSTALDNIVMSDISAVPGITCSLKLAINWLFCLMRNKRIQTAVLETLYKDDASTTLATSAKSDDGVTFSRGEYS